MSEDSGVAPAVEVTPVEPTGSEPSESTAPSSPPAEGAAPENMSVLERRQRMREGLKTKEPVTPERDETGRFTSPDDPAPAEPEEESPEISDDVAPAAEVTPEESEEVEASPDEGDGTVVLEIPEWHPLRDRGKTELPPVPAEWEQEFRSMLNNAVRRAEVEQSAQELERVTNAAKQLESTSQFWQERALFFATNPDIALRVNQMRENLGDEEAQRYVVGLMQEDMQALQSKLSEQQEDVGQQQINQQAQRFVNMARTAMSQRYEGVPMQQINAVIAQYGTLIETGHYPEPHADTLFEVADKMLGAPNAGGNDGAADQPTVDIEELRAQIKQEVIEQLKSEEEENRANRATNPMGRVADTRSVRQAGGAPPNVSDTGDGQQVRRNVADTRRNLRKNVRLGGQG